MTDSSSSHPPKRSSDAEASRDRLEEHHNDEFEGLDSLDVEGVAQKLGGESKRRPWWISAVVVLACAYPLVTMWADFRYWLRSSEPEQLPPAAELFSSGSRPALHNRFVTIDGTPDVQWATKLKTRSGAEISFLRIIEAGGALFAAVPKRAQAGDREFPGRFTGRVTRFGESRAFAWIRQLHVQENISQSDSVTPDALVAALRSADGGALQIHVGDTTIHAEPEYTIELQARSPDVRVLLGDKSFPERADADAAVAALGYPYVGLGSGKTGLWRYAVRIPAPEREHARKRLVGAIAGEVDEHDVNEGVLVSPLTSTYTAQVGQLELDGDAIVVRGSFSASHAYTQNGDRLEPQPSQLGVRIASSELQAGGVQRPIAIDPDGYLIEVGVEPASVLRWALAWLLVFAIAVTNAVLLVISARRRNAIE